MACINCGLEVTSKYCPSCGQKADIKRLSIPSLRMDFQSRIYGFDGVFPRTLKDLTIRPGIASDLFIKGNRVLYVGPVGYFFLMIAMSLLIMELLGIDFFQMISSSSISPQSHTSTQENVTRLIIDFIYLHFRLVRFGLIPVTAFWIWMFYKKRGCNYIESSVPAFYAQGHLEILFIINVIVFYLSGIHFNDFSFIIEPLYYGFLFMPWLPSARVRSFFNGVLIWVLSYISFVFMIIIAASIWVSMNPELLEKLKSSP